MWSYLKSIFSFGYENSNEIVLTAEEEEEIINSLKDPHDVDTFLLKEFNNYETEERVGVITNVNGNIAVIDDIYYFTYNPIPNDPLLQNDKVKFTVYFNEIDTIVKNVEKINNDEVGNAEEDSPIHNNEEDSKSNVISTLSGQIFNRNKRIFEVKVDNKFENIHFDLNKVKSEFIPHLGDFVDLDVILPSQEILEGTNIENIKVVKVRPRKTALKVGNITSWDNKYGSISNFALFSLGVCEAGFTPALGYKVCASLIRSDCVNGYKWRAIQVIPRDNVDNVPLSGKTKFNFEEELRNKRGIFISIVPKFNLKLNEEVNFNIEVSNKSSLDKIMTFSPFFKFEKNQVESLNRCQNDIVIKAGGVIELPFKIMGKFVGKSYEDFIFDFVDFKIRRRIIFEVICDSLSDSVVPDINFHRQFSKNISSRDIISKTEGEIFPGRKKFSSCFIPVKIGEFRLPKIYLETVLPESASSFIDTRLQIEEYFPYLKVGLNPETFREYMHTLLFLEEVECLKKIALLDIQDASFIKYLDFLILKVPEHSFYLRMLLPGDSVLVSLPWNKEKKMQGIIHKITKSELWLKFSKGFHSEYKEGTTYFTSFICSRMSFRRKHEAIDVALKYLGAKWLFPSCVEPQPPQVAFEELEEGTSPFNLEESTAQEDSVSSSDDLVAKYMGRGRGKKSFKGLGSYWNCQGSGYGRGIRVREYEPDIDTVITKKVEWFNKLLNNQQKQAVLRILYGIARPLPYIIFGPPGTGKTVTIVESILQVHKLIPKSNILVGTPTNSAADLIGIRLMEYGNLQEGDFLRLVAHSYAEQGRLISSLVPYSAVPSFSDKSLIEENEECDLPSFNRNQIGQHRIIVATLSCIGYLYNMGFPRGYFTHIFIDEAGQAIEPEFLIPMAFLSPTTGHTILSGDPLQLGPVVFSRYADTYGLSNSFLYRILNIFPYIKDPQGFSKNYGYDPRLVTKLVNNYRSLDGILQVFNTLFYDGDLIPNVSNETSEEALLLLNLKSFKITCPVIFHGLRGNCLNERDSKSCYNPQEIFQVFCYLNKLYFDGVTSDQIGIITPYQLQVQKIQEVLETHQLEAPKIGSVEEFQGQEKMVIILSLVRSSENSNDVHNADFVTNSRRVNVAISRARALLIIIGDPELLDKYTIWHRILKYCLANDSYVGCQPPERLKS